VVVNGVPICQIEQFGAELPAGGNARITTIATASSSASTLVRPGAAEAVN
jgi:hypothetical protein